MLDNIYFALAGFVILTGLKITNPAQPQHSTRIDDQWRVCFTWEAGKAPQVEIVDYQ